MSRLTIKELRSTIFLESKLSLENKIACTKLFIGEGFLAYNYETEKYENASLLLSEEYIEYPRNSLRYKNEDFVFSSSVDKNFMSYLIDGVSENARIVLKLSDEIAQIVGNFKYAYLDNAGDSPNDLEKTVEKLTLKHFFKYNYFGKVFIEKYGRAFFENFPAEKVEFITENVVRVDMVKDVFGKMTVETQNNVINYLSNFGIEKVKFYNYKNHWYD